MTKTRVPIPENVSGEVLFQHDHTCCICREKGKAVQVHHIDGDPSNNLPENFAVLCLEDHNGTQVTGGFGRKLSVAEVRRYRDDWLGRVAARRKSADELASRQMGRMTVDVEVGQDWERPPQAMLNAYINHLPDLLKEVLATAREEWDTGVNSRMKNATTKLVDILQRVLVQLAAWYSPITLVKNQQQYILKNTS